MSPTVDTSRATGSISARHPLLVDESPLPPTTKPTLRNSGRSNNMLANGSHVHPAKSYPLGSPSRRSNNSRLSKLSKNSSGNYTDEDGGGGSDCSDDSDNDNIAAVDEYHGGSSIDRQNHALKDTENAGENVTSGCRASGLLNSRKASNVSFGGTDIYSVNSSSHAHVRDVKLKYFNDATNNSVSPDLDPDSATGLTVNTTIVNGGGRGERDGDLTSCSQGSLRDESTHRPDSAFKNASSPAILCPFNSTEDFGLKYSQHRRSNKIPDLLVKPPGAMTATLDIPPIIDTGDGPDGLVTLPEVNGSPRRHRMTSDPNHVSHQFFHLEPCLYSHRMFLRAARIFSVLKHDDADTEETKALRRRTGGPIVDLQQPKEKIPEMDFLDAQEQIKTFELTFATLKFQKLFSAILDYIGFFIKYPELNDSYSLVYVVLHDLQTRKFQRRVPFPNEVLDPECSEVEEAILTEKTKLQANIAKERIKHNAPSVDYLLPEHVRNKDETKAKTPVYMWVNQMKTTIENVVSNLKDDDFRQVEKGTDMSEVTDHAFLIDAHCPDVITFPPHLSMELKASEMVKTGLLVQQDKSSCLAPQSILHLLGIDQDALHVNIGTGTTTCHLASLLRQRSPHTHIWAFGVSGPQKAGKVIRNMDFLDVKNVKIVHEEFLNVDPEDPRFKTVRVILITANCSKSAITSPVQFIVSEGEDTQILGELSVGEADMDHVRDLMVDHERLLKHALKFPKLQAVVYTTRSRFEMENELVVTKVLEFVNMTSAKRNIFKVAPPVLPFSVNEINTGKCGVDGRFLRFLPSDKANGCFVAIIAREPEESKDAGRGGGDKTKSKTKLGKAKSATSAGSGGSRKLRKSVKVGISLPEVLDAEGDESSVTASSLGAKAESTGTVSLKQKLSQHKSPVAIGARLYQKGLIDRMAKVKTPTEKPEHMKVVKHPAPFREGNKSKA